MANLTDAQIVAAARKLLTEPTGDGGFKTLTQICQEVHAHHQAGLAFHSKYGDRLKELEPCLERSLAGWRELDIC